MVKLLQLKYKNLKANGGCEAVFNFGDEGELILISGKNGKGKSQFASALVFLLYGKNSDLKGDGTSTLPTSDLINDVNNKELLVTGIIKNGAKTYTITRGLKPTVLTIECDGIDLLKLSSKRLDQDFIEEVILNGITYSMFSRIIYISSKITSSPFYHLTPTKRKEFIEEILDVRLLMFINEVIKSRKADNNSTIRNQTMLMDQLADTKHTLEAQQTQHEDRYMSLLETYNQMLNESDGKIELLQAEVVIEKLKLDKIQPKILEAKANKQQLVDDDVVRLETNNTIIEAISKLDDAENKIKDRMMTANIDKTRAEDEYENHRKIHANFKACGTCPTLKEVASDYDFDGWEQRRTILQEAVDATTTMLEKVVKKRDELSSNMVLPTNEDEIDRIDLWLSKADTLTHGIQTAIKLKEGMIVSIVDSKKAMSMPEPYDTSALLEVIDKLDTLSSSHDETLGNLEILKSLEDYIKSDVVRKSLYDVYIPILKNYVTSFVRLFMADDLASFEILIDDNFDITLYKNRKKSKIFKLSEGQKGSINLAFLFAFQKLVELKGQVNFLMLDEVLDISFDASRLSYIINALKEMQLTGHKNIVIISHNPDLDEDLFDRIINVDSDQLGFTVYS